ncbi:MAG: alanine racemase [Planctomycetota bacterium]
MTIPASARCWLELDAAAIRRNAALARETAGVPLMAVVKADGYGHGAAVVARAALEGGARSLGVATASEAAALRAAGVEAPIQVLGSFLPEELPLLVEARAVATIHEAEDLQRLRGAARAAGRPLPAQLKVDVGMHRHGVAPERALELLAALARDPGIELRGLMTHLPCSAGADLTSSRAQVARFAALVAAADAAGLLPAEVHAAATAALFRLPESRFNQVRAGIALVGLDPAACLGGVELTPALSLRVRVMRTKDVPQGQAVGYGARWVAPRPSRIALLGIGYGDGAPYAWTQGGAEVLLQGQRCPLVGSVMMDYMAVDVTDLPRATEPGDVATLVGQDGAQRLTLEAQAARAGLIPYALACGLGGRLQRATVGAAASGGEEPARLRLVA